MGKLLKFARDEKMAKPPVDDRMTLLEWEKFAEWIDIPVEILTQLNGPEILKATQQAILRHAREAGERLPSKPKLPPLRK